MKLFERLDTERTFDRLPELPPGVKVPDDLSKLEPETTPKPLRATTGTRWMRWLAAIVLLGGAGVLTAVLVNNDEPVQEPVDYMQLYGTDNPAFVDGSTGPGTVVIAPAVDYMELYGTDNPVFVAEGDTEPVDTGEYMRLYGTDNPEFVEHTFMELYGTDNPEILEP